MIFKDIHIGQMIKSRIAEVGTEMSHICNFLKCSEEEVLKIYSSESLNTEYLLKFSKLLEYDFFRVYTQHLILYAPFSSIKQQQPPTKLALPQFRKNIYTKEVIDYILEQIQNGEMTKNEVMGRYRIPKTTLYKWISKYKK